MKISFYILIVTLLLTSNHAISQDVLIRVNALRGFDINKTYEDNPLGIVLESKKQRINSCFDISYLHHRDSIHDNFIRLGYCNTSSFISVVDYFGWGSVFQKRITTSVLQRRSFGISIGLRRRIKIQKAIFLNLGIEVPYQIISKDTRTIKREFFSEDNEFIGYEGKRIYRPLTHSLGVGVNIGIYYKIHKKVSIGVEENIYYILSYLSGKTEDSTELFDNQTGERVISDKSFEGRELFANLRDNFSLGIKYSF